MKDEPKRRKVRKTPAVSGMAQTSRVDVYNVVMCVLLGCGVGQNSVGRCMVVLGRGIAA